MAVIRPTSWRRVGDFAVMSSCDYTDRSGDFPALVTIRVRHDEDSLPECVGLTIEPHPGGPPITGAMLRSIPIAELVRRAVKANPVMRLRDPALGMEAGLEPLDPYEKKAARKAVKVAVERTRRTKITEDDLRWIADVHRRAELTGRSYIALAQQEARVYPFTSDMARQWWKKAREQGYAEEAGS